MNDTTLAIDLAKTVFEVAVSTRPGAVSRRRRLTRKQLSRFVEQQAPATILLEACSSSHYWGRRFQEIGHHVLLLHPQDVARYRKGQKTDRTDAKALLEAHRNEDIQPVPIKSPDQQALTSLHRLRSRWMASRTAGLNTIRGLLREFGLPIPVGATRVVPQVTAWLDEGTVHPALAPVLRDAVQDDGSPATSGSSQRSSRPDPSAAADTSTSAETCISEPCSSTAPAPYSVMPRNGPTPTASGPGRFKPRSDAATTSPPWPSQTNWPASPGPPGPERRTSERHLVLDHPPHGDAHNPR